MTDNERGREKETVRGTPGSAGDQAEKSKGKGDDALEKASVGGGKSSGADPRRNPTQDPPDDGGFTEDDPNEHG